MKLVTAIIRTFKLDDVQGALYALGIHRITVTDCKGSGVEKGHTERYRGQEFYVEFYPKIKLDLVVEEKMVEQVIEAILDKAHTGELGDGVIYVSTIDQMHNVRTKMKQ